MAKKNFKPFQVSTELGKNKKRINALLGAKQETQFLFCVHILLIHSLIHQTNIKVGPTSTGTDPVLR